MMKYLLALLIPFFVLHAAFGQKKVKYKDLFPILQSKDYKRAEADLLIFLANNDDEASAYYYLGEVISSKLDTVAIFPVKNQTYDSLIDEATKAYKKAIALVDEREVKKNDEYYMAYNRRDLRTGKFGIKVSDVHLDYENKIKILSDKKQTAKEVIQAKADVLMAQSALNTEIEKLLSLYPDDEAFLFRTATDNQNIFDNLIAKSSTLKEETEQYVAQLKSLDNVLYKTSINNVIIDSWESLEKRYLMFADNEITLPDYGTYFKALKAELNNKIVPLKRMLIATDAELTQAITKNETVKDSSALYQKGVPLSIIEGLVAYKTSPLAVSVLKYKTQKAALSALINSAINPVLQDSSNVYQRSKKINTILKKYEDLQRSISLVEDNKNEEALLNFSFYFDAFEPGLNEYITLEKAIITQRIKNYTTLNDLLAAQSRYVLYEDDSLYMPDVVPLTAEASYVQQLLEKPTHMLMAGTFKGSAFIAAVGYDMVLKDFTPIDTAESAINFITFQEKNLLQLKAEEAADFTSSILLIEDDASVVWRANFKGGDELNAAKLEAGIYFLYNNDEEIFLTLNKKGGIIGD